jgi:hypothetical protein
MPPEEFTIERAEAPPIIGRGSPKSDLRLKLEQLQEGEVLRWRPTQPHARSKAYHTAAAVATLTGATFKVRKENGGYDIYRIPSSPTPTKHP